MILLAEDQFYFHVEKRSNARQNPTNCWWWADYYSPTLTSPTVIWSGFCQRPLAVQATLQTLSHCLPQKEALPSSSLGAMVASCLAPSFFLERPLARWIQGSSPFFLIARLALLLLFTESHHRFWTLLLRLTESQLSVWPLLWPSVLLLQSLPHVQTPMMCTLQACHAENKVW